MAIDLIDESSWSDGTLITQLRTYEIPSPTTKFTLLEKRESRFSFFAWSHNPLGATVKFMLSTQVLDCDLPFVTQGEYVVDTTEVGASTHIFEFFRFGSSEFYYGGSLQSSLAKVGQTVGVQETYFLDGRSAKSYMAKNYQIATYDAVTIPLTGSIRLLPANPRRIMFTLGGQGTGQFTIGWSQDPSSVFGFTQANGFRTFHRRDFGPLITSEIYGFLLTGAPIAQAFEVYSIPTQKDI